MSDRARADHERNAGARKKRDFPVYRVVGLGFLLVYLVALIACAAFVSRQPALEAQTGALAVTGADTRSAPSFGRMARTLARRQGELAMSDSEPGALALALPSARTAPRNPLRDLDEAAPGPLTREGELSEIFSYGSDYTDADRDNTLSEIKGDVVQWTFAVGDVSARDERFRISSSSRDQYLGEAPLVRVRATVTPRDEQERAIIAALKSGDTVTVKGRIDDSFLRSLVLRPARLVLPTRPEQAAAGAATLPSASHAGSRNEVLTNGEARAFVARWTLRQLSPSSEYEVLPLYDRSVDYYQKGLVDKAYVERDKATYFERWPLRQLTIEGEPQVAAGSNAYTKSVSLTEVFVISNAEKEISGRERVTLVLRKRNGSTYIASEQGRLEEKHETSTQTQVLPPIAPG